MRLVKLATVSLTFTAIAWSRVAAADIDTQSDGWHTWQIDAPERAAGMCGKRPFSDSFRPVRTSYSTISINCCPDDSAENSCPAVRDFLVRIVIGSFTV